MPSRVPVKTAAKDVLILLGVIVAAEIVLRLTAPAYGHKVFDNVLTGSYPIGANADGYRGPIQPQQKPPGQLRILALGDSETFGTGVPVESTWPAHLGRELTERHPAAVVINGGLEGFGLRDIARSWPEKWRAYTPDVVVLGVTASMVSLEVARDGTFSFDEFAGRHGEAPSGLQGLKLSALRAYHSIYLVGYVSVMAQRALYWWGLLDHRVNPRAPFGHVLAYGWSQGDLPPGLAREAWTKFAADYRAFADDVRKAGARLIVVWLPPRFELSDAWRDNEKKIPRERFTLDPAGELAAIVHEPEAKLVNLLPPLKQARASAAAVGRYAPLYIHFDDVHLDDEGATVAAKAIAATLE